MAKTKLTPRDLQQYGYRIARRLARTSLPEILYVSTFILMRYLANSDFSYPSELIIPLVMFAIAATAAFYMYRLILRRTFTAHVAALPFIYSLYSFRYYFDSSEQLLRAILPRQWETRFIINMLLLIILAILFGLFGFVVVKLLSWKAMRGLQLPKVLIFVVSFLFLIQTLKVGIRIWEIRRELTYQYQATMPLQDKSKIKTKPDIYYLVFDRYGNDETLRDIYDHDNSGLANMFKTQGFVTRAEAYANYPFTMQSITSTLTLNYHTELGRLFGKDNFQTGFPYRSIFNDPPVAQILKQNGYNYNQVSSWWDFTRIGIKADSEPTKSFRLNFFKWHFYLSDLSRDILYKSVYSPLLEKGVSIGKTPLIKHDLDHNPRQNFENQLSALKNLAGQKQSQPQFTFAHVLLPHPPYVFDKDGSEPNYDHERTDIGADENVKYINELIYLNKRLEELIRYMRLGSPDAVIIVQADEGPYPKEFRHELTPDNFYNPINLALPQMRQKFGIQASYFLPGVDEQTVKQNITASVNSFRFVLAHYLGYSLDMLPDCNFASGNKFNVYDYQLVTDKLTGKPSPPACSFY